MTILHSYVSLPEGKPHISPPTWRAIKELKEDGIGCEHQKVPIVIATP